MKKLFFLLFVFITIKGFAQYPVKQRIGGDSTEVWGTMFWGKKGLVNGVYLDTASANLSRISQYPYAQIAVGDTIWYRNTTATRWIKFGSGTAGGPTIIYVKDDLTVDTITNPGFQTLGRLHSDGLESGGILTSAGCMDIQITSASYYLNNGTHYISPATVLTVSAADPADPRKDLVVVDTFGVVSIITGTPSPIPNRPYYNTASQLVINEITVPAGATCLAINTIVIYDETGGTEYTHSTVGTITADPVNTDNPNHLSVADFVSTYGDLSRIIFEKPSGQDTVFNNSVFKWFLYFNGRFNNQIQMQLFLSGVPVSNNIVVNPYFNILDSNQYQPVAVPAYAFSAGGDINFDLIVFTLAGDDLSGAKGFYLDYLQLQTGIQNTTSGKGVIFYGKNAAGDSTILLREDGVRFAAKDSSGGAGTAPNLQQVLDVGDVASGRNILLFTDNPQTTNSFISSINAETGEAISLVESTTDIPSGQAKPALEFLIYDSVFTGAFDHYLRADHLTGHGGLHGWTWQLPNDSGTIALSVNGNRADVNGNITLPVGGSGTVTNIATGYALSGGPITSTGTIIVDSAALSLKYLRIVDTTSKWVNNVTKNATNDSFYIWKGSGYTALKDSSGGAASTALANFYLKDSTLSSNRTVTQAGKTLDFRGSRVGFDSTITGTDYTRIGLLLNENFSAGSIPSGWTKGANITTVYTGAKVTITGAAAIGAPSAGSITTAFLSALQYDTRRMPYENLDFQMSVVPTTKSANAIVGVYKGVLGLTVFAQEGIAWDLSNGTNSGRVALTSGFNGSGGNAVPTFTTNVDSTSKMNFSVNDSLILYYKKRGWGIVAGIINKTTGKITATYFNQRWNGSGGRWNLVFLNGTYVLTNAKVNVLDKKGGVVFIGDSQIGYGNSQISRRFPDLLFQSNYKYFSVWGLPSLSGKYFGDGGLTTELITDVQPAKVIEAFGYNDESEPFTAPNTKTYIDSIVFPLQRAGITVGIVGIVPRIVATDIWNDSLSSLAAGRGADFYDIRTPLKNSSGYLSGTYAYDVHVNDSGAIVVANVIRAKSGDSLFTEMYADTNYVQKLYGLSNARTETTARPILINNDGSLSAGSNRFPTPEGWIQNKLKTNIQADLPQLGEIHVSAALKSDSSLIVKTTQGLRIGFHNDDATATTGANINIANNGGGGTSQLFNSLSGNGNIFMSASSTNRPKTSVGSISGNNNTFLNYYLQSTITGADNTVIGNYNWIGTSGSSNIFVGAWAGKGITTGSGNLHLITANGGSQSLTSSLANTILLGEMTTYDPYVAGDIAFSTGYTASTHNFWFGSKGGTGLNGTTLNFPAPASATTNATGFPAYIRVGRGVSAGLPGSLAFQTWTPLGTGTTYQSTAITKILMDYMGLGFGTTTVTTHAADLLADFQSTTQGIAAPRMTTTQRDLLQTGVQTLAVSAAGSGYTNGNVVLVFSGGGGSGAAGYAVIATGVVSSVVLTARGSGYTSAPSATVTSGAGTGATFTVNIGGTAGSSVYNSTIGANNTYNGTNWTSDFITSSAGTLTLAHGIDYVFTGTTSTWTLPAVSATLLGRGNIIKIKNRGSGTITLNSNAGNTLYNTAAVGTINVVAGAACELMPDGTYFLVMFNQ